MGRVDLDIKLLTIAVLGVLASGARAEAPAKMTAKDLPATVLAAVQKAYPKAIIENVDTEREGDVTYFELETKDGEVSRDLLYAADGTLHEIEEAVEAKDLPSLVRQAVAKAYPKGTIKEAGRLWRGADLGYELELTSGASTYELVVGADGTIHSSREIAAGKTGGKGDAEGEDEDEDDDDEKGK